MIEYFFKFENQKEIFFQIDLRRKTNQIQKEGDHPAWTKLEFQKCENCPIESGVLVYCPAAVDVAKIVKEFADLESICPVSVLVKTENRNFQKDCDVQTGLNSLLGLVLASSECPILSQLRPLANFHLPFATPDETIFRTVSCYLIKQLCVSENGGFPDFSLKGLEQLYKDLEIVNTFLAQRVTHVSPSDANVNAVSNFFCLSWVIRSTICEQLSKFSGKFFSTHNLEPSA